MRRWLRELDRILRGETTRLAALRGENMEIPLGGLLLLILLMAMWYGTCMGSFAGSHEGGPLCMQWLASIIKVPALFFLTIAVTFPSLYVFNALVGSRLNLPAVFQLLVASLAVNVAVLASIGPIVAFFSVSTTSYYFTLLLNVLVFTVSGVLGLAFLLQTLHRLSVARRIPSLPWPPPSQPPSKGQPAEGPGAPGGSAASALADVLAEQPAEEEPSALAALPGCSPDRQVKIVFICWMVIFALVGTQMAWVLRPFVGKPGESFQWLCARESNFFQAVWQALRALLS
jgi:hypothetical protein